MEFFLMMGRNDKPQKPLFYAFNLDELVPQDHLLRKIDHFLDLSDLHEHLAPYYSHTGRPSVDPELIIRMLIIGYCLGIRSERRLCEEVKLNLAYRWFCRLGIEDPVPDHSTFSKNRHGRFREAEVLRHVFEQVLQSCIDTGLVGGEGFAVDASVVKADASRQRYRDDDDDWGSGPGVRDYLDGLQEDGADGVAPPKRVSPTDPQARWTAAPGGPAFYAYSTNYLVDTDAGIIVDVEATPAHRTLEVQSTKTMIDRVEERLALKTKKLIGDTAYGTAEFLAWMVEDKGIEPHVPVWEMAERKDGTFSRSDFRYDAVNDEYTCPAGKQLKKYWTRGWQSRSNMEQGSTLRYHSLKKDCHGCALKEQCCPNTLRRKVTRSVHEAARDVARAVAKTPVYRQTRRQRKQVEMLFAHMKRVLKMDRLRLRGIKGAQDEFLLTATAQNLRRMAKYLGTGPPGIPEMA
jgi:transposase